MSKSFGTLLIYDLKNCESPDLNNKEVLQKFIDVLVEYVMEMKKVGDTKFEYFDRTPFNVANDLVGYSITQIISLSSITIHICEISKNLYLDCFTCCKINDKIKEDILQLIKMTFKPTSLEIKFIDRN